MNRAEVIEALKAGREVVAHHEWGGNVSARIVGIGTVRYDTLKFLRDKKLVKLERCVGQRPWHAAYYVWAGDLK